MAVRARLLALVLVGVVAGCGSGGSSRPRSGLVDIGAGLRGPDGLRATVYARGLRLASSFAFDAQRRLWVATWGSLSHGTDGVYLVARRGARPVNFI